MISRPKRIAGQMRTQDFIKHWNTGANSFKASPPNATIAVFRDANRITDGIVELSEPKVDGPDLSFKVDDAASVNGSLWDVASIH